jgi:hypothetical protein
MEKARYVATHLPSRVLIIISRQRRAKPCLPCVAAGEVCVNASDTGKRCERCFVKHGKCFDQLETSEEVGPAKAGPTPKRGREEVEIMEKVVAVATPGVRRGGMKRKESTDSLGAGKRARSDAWTAVRGSPAPSTSGASGNSSSSFFFAGSSRESIEARRDAFMQAALETQLLEMRGEAEASKGKYEGLLTVWRDRYGEEWPGQRD